MSARPPTLIWELFKQLQRRHLPLGPDNLADLLNALRAGFGWESPRDLRRLVCALWAKSQAEEAIVIALFDQLAEQEEGFDWQVSLQQQPLPGTPAPNGPDSATQAEQGSSTMKPSEASPVVPEQTELQPVAEAAGGLPPISFEGLRAPDYHFIFTPDYHITYRETAQAWRRLRQPVREGPLVELDVTATIRNITHRGGRSAPVLAPRRRNSAYLILLVDRKGSMVPFHGLVDDVCNAIRQSGNLKQTTVYYFHDCPVTGYDEQLAGRLGDRMFPPLDSILAKIEPANDGELFKDPALSQPVSLKQVLANFPKNAAVVVISDSGAARGHYDVPRLIETVAFLKAIKNLTPRTAWLNPLPRSDWNSTSAAQLARHMAMFPLDRAGMYAAVNHLRGRPVPLEWPL